MYLDENGTYVRKIRLPEAVGIPVAPDDKPDPAAPPRRGPSRGIMVDGRRPSAKLGKEAFDIKVD